jgi:adenylate cyclase
VTLLDGESGAQRWAQRYDVDRAALSRLVDDLATKLARAVDLEMVRSAGSAAARLGPQEVGAEDLAMQGWAALYRGVNRQTSDEARALFERAVTMDARSVRGWGGVAYASSIALRRAQSEQDLTRLEMAAAQLERLDPDGYYGILSRGLVAYHRRDWPAALAAGTRMIERFPGHHAGYQMRGPVLLRTGHFEEALDDTDKAIGLLPNNPDPLNEWRRSFIYFGLHRYAESAAQGRQVMVKTPTSLPMIFVLAAALARDNRPDEARQVLDEARRQVPDLSTAKVAQLQFEGSGERFIAAREDMLAALREAGLP